MAADNRIAWFASTTMKGRMMFRKLLFLLFTTPLGLMADDVSVTSVIAQQRCRGNGTVDIAVMLEGAAADVAQVGCKFSATNCTTRVAIPVTKVSRIGSDTGSGNVWTRQFVWDASADVGVVKVKDLALVVEVEPLGGVQLWEDGPYWAECNVGATKPEEGGYYFWWGDTIGYMLESGAWCGNQYADVTWISSSGHIMDESPFSPAACPTYDKDISTLQTLGYIDSAGNLVAAHDAATQQLGAPWRMPTGAELSSLVSKCTATWKVRNGVYGLSVTGKGTYDSQSIFLPAFGLGDDASLCNTAICGNDAVGYYWSSTAESLSSYRTYIRKKGAAQDRYSRTCGLSVRPLREFCKTKPMPVGAGVTTHFGIDCRTYHILSVEAFQRYPWNGLVDITVKIQGDIEDIAEAECLFFATNNANMAAVSIATISTEGADAISGDICTRRFLWNAATDVGEVKIDNLALMVHAVSSGGVRLWDGGPYWAACNVGAFKPEDVGYYFWWGDTVGYVYNSDNDHWISNKDGTAYSFSPQNCPTYGKDMQELFGEGYVDSANNLAAAHDAATAHSGTPWRTPSFWEFQALINNCAWTRASRNGVGGWLISGRGAYVSKSIFMPAAGSNRFWTSTPSYGDADYSWDFIADGFCPGTSYRYKGQPIRPVRGTDVKADLSFASDNGMAASLMLDCRDCPRPCFGNMETLRYDANWYENGNEVRISDNGKIVMTGAVGCYAWYPDLLSSLQHTLQMEVLSEGQVVGTATARFEIPDGKIGGLFKSAYSVTDTHDVQVEVDGVTVLTATNAGMFVWQPKSIGEHELRYIAGTNVSIQTVNVTNIDFAVAKEPDPPSEADDTISLASEKKVFASATLAANMFAVTSTVPGKEWDATVSDDWILLVKTTGLCGSDRVAYRVIANTNAAERTGYVYVNGHVHTVVQPGAGASLRKDDPLAFDCNGTPQTVYVDAEEGVHWDVTSKDQWVVIRPTSGDGAGEVTIFAAPFVRVGSRSGSATVAGKEIIFTQNGCDMELSRYETNCPAAGSTVTVGVTARAEAAWSVTPHATWISVASLTGGIGNGHVVLSVDTNEGHLTRTGMVTIGTETITIVQAPSASHLSVSRIECVPEASECQISVYVDSDVQWAVSNGLSWVTIRDGSSGIGPGIVSLGLSPNPSVEARSGTLTVAGLPLVIYQSPAGTMPNVDRVAHGRDVDMGEIVVDAADYLSWSAATTNKWIEIYSNTDFIGPGTVGYIVGEAAGNESRIGILWVGRTPIYICQCGFDVALGESAEEVSRVSGDGQIAVSVGADEDEWCAETTVPWITLAEDRGTGDGIIQYSYEDNTTGVERVGRILVCNQIFTLTQTEADSSARRWQITYENLKGAENKNPDHYYEGDVLSFLALPNVSNFTFEGWSPSAIVAGFSGDKVVTANWNWVPSDAVVDAGVTSGKPLNIKADWAKRDLVKRFGTGKDRLFLEKFGADFSAALIKSTGKRDGAGNELAVWHDYVAGTDPTDSNSVFKAKVEMKNGMPVVEWEPNLNSNGEERVYTVWGKNALIEAWHSPTNGNDHFFKVDVAMPVEGTIAFNLGGASGSIDSTDVRVGKPIGALPTPTRSGYQFLGWFTEAEGGIEITAETIVAADMTIYARWKTLKVLKSKTINGYLTGTDTLLLEGVNLSDVTNMAAFVGGQHITHTAGSYPLPASVFHVVRTDQTISAQLQVVDGDFVKCVGVTLSQVGNDIYGKVAYSGRFMSGKNNLGYDFSRDEDKDKEGKWREWNCGDIATSDSTSGYGVKKLCLEYYQ